jgi:hypothetical protein
MRNLGYPYLENGSNYAVSEVDPSTDTLTGGPTKQELAWTDPGILGAPAQCFRLALAGGSGGFTLVFHDASISPARDRRLDKRHWRRRPEAES